MKNYLLLLCLLLHSFFSYSQTRYWRGAVSSDWNVAGNWSSNQSSQDVTTVPDQNSQVFFDANSVVSCDLGTATTISQFSMTGGTLNLGTTGALTVNSTFNMTGGTFNAGSGTISVPSNPFTLGGGAFNAGSSTINFGNQVTFSSVNSFNAGTSTVVFNGASNQTATIDVAAVATIVFYNLIMDKLSNSSLTLASNGSPADSFQVNNLAELKDGLIAGSAFLKIEKDLHTFPAYDGSSISIGCTGDNPGKITIEATGATGPSGFVGIIKNASSVTVDAVGINPAAAITLGNPSSPFVVSRGIFRFPDNPLVNSYFNQIRIEPEGTFICPRNSLNNFGNHVNTGGKFLHNNGTYIFSQPPGNNVSTSISDNIDTFYNLIIDKGVGQFSPSANNILLVENDLTLRTGQLQASAGSAFNLKGNFVFETTMVPSSSGTMSIIFSGTTDQTVLFGAGKENGWKGNITIDKPSGKLILGSPMILDMFNRAFTFTKGVVESSTANYLRFDNNYTAIGASNASYVDGPVRITVSNFDGFKDAIFEFPTGNNGFYAPVMLDVGGSSSIFSVQYFHKNPLSDGFSPGLKDATLSNVSQVEYWDINRTTGTSGAKVLLSYSNARSGGVTQPSELRVARWDGAKWTDGGNDLVPNPTPPPNYIKSVTEFSSFSPFTLASINQVNNPLPVHFISFTGKRTANGALLKWVSDNEVNNDHFEVRRSANGFYFETIGRVAAQASSQLRHEYSFTDNAVLPGKNYYQLKQVDIDGTSMYSDIITINSLTGNIVQVNVYAHPGTGVLSIRCSALSNQQSQVEIINSNGQVIKRAGIGFDASGQSQMQTQLSKGVYILRITSKESSYTKQFILR